MAPNVDDLPPIPDDREDDPHGLESAEKAELVIFMAGNQFLIFCDPMKPAASSLTSGSRLRRAETGPP